MSRKYLEFHRLRSPVNCLKFVMSSLFSRRIYFIIYRGIFILLHLIDTNGYALHEPV